jgi:hypothetical protein
MRLLGVLVLGVSLLAASTSFASECRPLSPGEIPAGSALATPGQGALEELALRVRAQPRFQAEVRRVEALYAADAQGATITGKATIQRAADAIAQAAIYYAISEAGVQRPVALWVSNAPHEWMGRQMPRSGYGIDNPDNVYRQAMLDGGSRYEIHGRVRRPGPVEQHFQIMGGIPGLGPMTAEGGDLPAQIRSDQLAIEANGHFCISIDAAPANGRRNHLQLPGRGTYLLVVRDLFTDWNTQKPVWLDIRRVEDEATQRDALALDAETIAGRAVEILSGIAPYWVDYDNRFVFTKPVNQVTAPRVRPAGRGLSMGGHFDLAPGEALLVTVDALGAGSLGFQLTDPWGVAYEYVGRSSSLNNAQARPNGDGTYTFVISATDPGVHNWLDPEGFGAGMFAIRWQVLPGAVSPERAIREVSVQTHAALRESLPADVFVTPAERRAQLEARARAHARRLTE